MRIGHKALGVSVGISQDNVIFAAIAIAFVIYITMRGELPTYLGFFAPSKKASASSGATLGPAGITPNNGDPYAGIVAGLANPATLAISQTPVTLPSSAQGSPNVYNDPSTYTGLGSNTNPTNPLPNTTVPSLWNYPLTMPST